MVISGVISPLIWVIVMVTLLITPLITTHEPPSSQRHNASRADMKAKPTSSSRGRPVSGTLLGVSYCSAISWSNNCCSWSDLLLSLLLLLLLSSQAPVLHIQVQYHCYSSFRSLLLLLVLPWLVLFPSLTKCLVLARSVPSDRIVLLSYLPGFILRDLRISASSLGRLSEKRF